MLLFIAVFVLVQNECAVHAGLFDFFKGSSNETTTLGSASNSSEETTEDPSEEALVTAVDNTVVDKIENDSRNDAMAKVEEFMAGCDDNCFWECHVWCHKLFDDCHDLCNEANKKKDLQNEGTIVNGGTTEKSTPDPGMVTTATTLTTKLKEDLGDRSETSISEMVKETTTVIPTLTSDSNTDLSTKSVPTTGASSDTTPEVKEEDVEKLLQDDKRMNSVKVKNVELKDKLEEVGSIEDLLNVMVAPKKVPKEPIPEDMKKQFATFKEDCVKQNKTNCRSSCLLWCFDKVDNCVDICEDMFPKPQMDLVPRVQDSEGSGSKPETQTQGNRKETSVKTTKRSGLINLFQAAESTSPPPPPPDDSISVKEQFEEFKTKCLPTGRDCNALCHQWCTAKTISDHCDQICDIMFKNEGKSTLVPKVEKGSKEKQSAVESLDEQLQDQFRTFKEKCDEHEHDCRKLCNTWCMDKLENCVDICDEVFPPKTKDTVGETMSKMFGTPNAEPVRQRNPVNIRNIEDVKKLAAQSVQGRGNNEPNWPKDEFAHLNDEYWAD